MLIKRIFVLLAAPIGVCSYADESIKILRSVWEEISNSERMEIQKRYIVDLRDPAAYALIMDNQGVNESSAGTTGGAALGGAVGNAMHIDRALQSGNNYSAKTQLAAGLLGALIGSSLDKPATQQYHFRYAMQLHNGEISYVDSIQYEPFRHPIGICLELSTISRAPQILCTQTVQKFRKAYLGSKTDEITVPLKEIGNPDINTVNEMPASVGRVECKLGNLAPVSTTPEKCQQIGGKPL